MSKMFKDRRDEKDEMIFSKQPTMIGPKLRAPKLLSDVFPRQPDITHIHVVVRVPGKGEYH